MAAPRPGKDREKERQSLLTGGAKLSPIRPVEPAARPRRDKGFLTVILGGLFAFFLLFGASSCWQTGAGVGHLRGLAADQKARDGTNSSAGDFDLSKSKSVWWLGRTWQPKSLVTARQDVYAPPPPNRTSVLECLQVAQPVLMPYGAANSDGSTAAKGGSGSSCTVTLMEHSFATSYGEPFVGNYTPPSCSFNRVVINFTAVSQGRQFDRLALMYFGDTEVWRTSTAEPSIPPGIRWQYLKDMTPYMSLWKNPQTLIFDLGNLINENYTAAFNTTLTATFFTAIITTDTAPPADTIIPISARLGSVNNSVSQFTLPKQNATNVISDFPRNAQRAVFSISACGQATEEFWWSNVLQSDSFTFNDTVGPLPGYSPFREVQLLVDGHLAGVQWPFPVIFTGGIVPGLHRPVAGIDTFDLKEHEIDITPFLPLLCDGKKHNFTMLVAGLDDDGSTATMTQTVDTSWYITGKIFVWLDSDSGSITTGDKPTVQSSDPAIAISRTLRISSNGTNSTLDFTTNVRRTVSVSGRVALGNGSSRAVTWSQQLSYTNVASILQSGYASINNFTMTGTESASGLPDGQSYLSEYTYPLFANSSTLVTEQGNVTLFAHVIAGKQVQVSGPSVFPSGLEAYAPGTAVGKKFASALLTTTKDGTATYAQSGDGKNATSYGQSNQVFRFGGVTSQGSLFESTPDVELYFRNVTATNGSVSYDKERSAGMVVASVNLGADTNGAQDGANVSAGGNESSEDLGIVFAQPPHMGVGIRGFMGRADVGRA